jgi:heme-degrading monooxygenase HmoA
MIARIWHGATSESESEKFFEYMNQTGIKDCGATPGNLGVYVLRRIEEGKSHFLFITLWESIETIKRFAGDNINQAVYYPDDKIFLPELEPYVVHYEVLSAPQLTLS